LSRTACNYRSRREHQEAIRPQIVEIDQSSIRYGYKRIHMMLKREGIQVNKKRVNHQYCLEDLQLSPNRNVSGARRKQGYVASIGPNKIWTMGFVSNPHTVGNKFRILTVVDTDLLGVH